MDRYDTISGLDKPPETDFGLEEKPSNPFLRQLGEAIGWTILLTGFMLAMTCLTPPQRSAEADLFEAQMNGEVPK